jgi:hypothetical protein
MTAKYHVGSKGTVLGEKTAEEILSAIASGELTRSDKVWLPGWADWQTIAETPELQPQSVTTMQGPEWFENPSFASFWQTFRTILVKPGNFAHLKPNPKLSLSFYYLLMATLLNSFAATIVLVVSGVQLAGLPSMTLAGIFFGAAILGSLLLSTLFTLLTHWGVRLTGGRYPLRTTFATLLPCQGAGILLSLIPVAGLLLSVWPFVSGIIALAGSQHISVLKSALIQIAVVFLAIFILMVAAMVPVIALLAVSR